ncbi:Replication protein A 70 kDa DNA-binding subunit C [Linum perenne]
MKIGMKRGISINMVCCMGNDIWGMIPEGLISSFDFLEDQQVYIIQNFKVVNAPNQFRPVANRYAIEFSASTAVEKVENISAIPEYNFTFIHESEIPTNIHNRLVLFDTIGYVEEYRQPRVHSTKWKELILKITKDFSVLVLVWGEWKALMDAIVAENGDNPFILIVTSVFVREFNGKPALSTSSATQFYANPKIPQIAEFKERDTDDTLPTPVYTDPSDITSSNLVTLEQLNAALTVTENQDKYFIVSCRTEALKDGWCYTGCESCSKKVDDKVPDYFCCKIVRTNTTARYRIQLEVFDDTNKSDLVLLDNLGESILGLPAERLYQINGNDRVNPPILITNLVGKEMKVQVQVKAYNIRTGRNEFTITQIIDAPKAIHPSTSPEHMTAFGESPKSPKSCVSTLQSATPKSLNVVAQSAVKFKAKAINFDEDIEDVFTDEVPLATMRKKLKRRRCQISNDE